MALVNPSLSGATRGPNLAITRPSRPTRYFWKFHATAPAIFLSGWLVRNRYSGHWSSPLTETLAKTSKVAFFLAQNALI